jgi:uncharacterized protein YbjT (DUF2867 family)
MYLVTGATGNVGSAIVDQLLALGEQVRVFTRNPGKVARWGNQIEIAIGDFTQPETFADAFKGVEAAFLMSGGPGGEPFQQLVDAARQQGTTRIVFLSTILAGDPIFAIGKLHKEKEDAIIASGLSGTFLRPGGFMSNTFQWAGSIKSDGVVYNPMGTGQFAPIAPEDIAAVAVKALLSPSLPGQIYELTGAQLINVPQQVETLSKLLNRPLRTVDISTETAVENMVRVGVPAPIAAGVGKSFEAIRNGRAATLTDTVVQVTGNPATTFESWARKHAAIFA